MPTVMSRFQSTPLTRGETPCGPETGTLKTQISIHSPHTRGDERRACGDAYSREFQSTPLTRGETINARAKAVSESNFNPLPSHEGRLFLTVWERKLCLFQSTPLTRGETMQELWENPHQRISIHSPHTRGDVGKEASKYMSYLISIHSPHTRGDGVL